MALRFTPAPPFPISKPKIVEANYLMVISAQRQTAGDLAGRTVAAVQAIKSGMSYRRVASTFHIPIASLHARVTNPSRIPQKPGRKRALTEREEELLVAFLVKFAQKGVPLSQQHLREAVETIIGRMLLARRLHLPFSRFSPGPAFLRSFRRRHARSICFAKPLRHDAKRFYALNSTVLTTHFATVERLIADHSLDASCIFNLDETGVSPEKDITGITSKRFMPRFGSRDCKLPIQKRLDRITMMHVICANGEAGPPLFVFKRSRLPFRMLVRDGVEVKKHLHLYFHMALLLLFERKRERWIL